MVALIKYLLWFISSYILCAQAAAPLSYCKCTCGKSSSIIALTEDIIATPARPCTDCTRIFCLTNSGLDACPSLDDKNSDIVVTQSCFQRESRKDEGIVIGYILIIGGLLAYAMMIRPFMEKRRARQEEQYNAFASR